MNNMTFGDLFYLVTNKVSELTLEELDKLEFVLWSELEARRGDIDDFDFTDNTTNGTL